MTGNTGVLIFAEAVDGKLAPITRELLGIGRKLADDLREDLSALVVGNSVANVADEAIAFGADKVYLAEDPQLQDYSTDSYTAVVEKTVKLINPRILLLGQTDIGRDLAPRVAFRLSTAVTMDCVALEIEAATKLLLQTKPVYGGNAQAVYTTKTFPQMATVRAKAMTALTLDYARRGGVVKIDAGPHGADVRTWVVRKVVQEVEGVKLDDASVIVSGGRGIGGPEGFKQLEELAKVLKGALGASRPPCDSGWVPDTLQIGLTGKIVTPDVYIAVAISGTGQHLAGCSGAKNIVAVNRDPEANIFTVARFGAVGDWQKVLPAFQQKIKELQEKQ
jgi:electron transfer flavoprotein alpha subunit